MHDDHASLQHSKLNSLVPKCNQIANTTKSVSFIRHFGAQIFFKVNNLVLGRVTRKLFAILIHLGTTVTVYHTGTKILFTPSVSKWVSL